MLVILHDRVHIASNVNATVIPLDQAPDGCRDLTAVLRASTSWTRTEPCRSYATGEP